MNGKELTVLLIMTDHEICIYDLNKDVILIKIHNIYPYARLSFIKGDHSEVFLIVDYKRDE